MSKKSMGAYLWSAQGKPVSWATIFFNNLQHEIRSINPLTGKTKLAQFLAFLFQEGIAAAAAVSPRTTILAEQFSKKQKGTAAQKRAQRLRKVAEDQARKATEPEGEPELHVPDVPVQTLDSSILPEAICQTVPDSITPDNPVQPVGQPKIPVPTILFLDSLDTTVLHSACAYIQHYVSKSTDQITQLQEELAAERTKNSLLQLNFDEAQLQIQQQQSDLQHMEVKLSDANTQLVAAESSKL